MTATNGAAEVKKTRGEGLVKVSFANHEKADHKRVPSGVLAVVINGKSYALSDIPATVKDQLVAFAFKARAATYVNNHADEAKAGADVHELVDKVHADLKAGKLYAEVAEGGTGPKAGKTFDASDYIAAIVKTREIKHQMNPAIKLVTEHDKETIREKLLAMTGKERIAWVNAKFKAKGADHIMKSSLEAVQASKRVAKYKADVAAGKTVDAVEDLF